MRSDYAEMTSGYIMNTSSVKEVRQSISPDVTGDDDRLMLSTIPRVRLSFLHSCRHQDCCEKEQVAAFYLLHDRGFSTSIPLAPRSG